MASPHSTRPQPVQFELPLRHTVEREAVRAIRSLVAGGLVTETEAVRTLQDWGASADEVELVRTLAAIRRGRVA